MIDWTNADAEQAADLGFVLDRERRLLLPVEDLSARTPEDVLNAVRRYAASGGLCLRAILLVGDLDAEGMRALRDGHAEIVVPRW